MEATGLRDLSNGQFGLIDHLSKLEVTRVGRTRFYWFDDIIALTIMAVISGANA